MAYNVEMSDWSDDLTHLANEHGEGIELEWDVALTKLIMQLV